MGKMLEQKIDKFYDFMEKKAPLLAGIVSSALTLGILIDYNNNHIHHGIGNDYIPFITGLVGLWNYGIAKLGTMSVEDFTYNTFQGFFKW